MKTLLKSFAEDKSGATMIEYGLIAALVSVAAIIALTALGVSISDIFGTTSDTVAATIPGS